jgi:AcrR family transcriptional regulator
MTDSLPTGARRERDRAATRARIIDTALAILETEGVAALTMRRIASDMEYTAPVIYQHFAGKNALVLELVDHGYGRLMAEMSPLEGEPDPARRLLLAASEYVRFAGEHPHLYEAMNGTAVAADDRRRIAQPAIAVLLELLANWSRANDVDLGEGEEACEIVWGTLTGMAAIGRLDTVGNARAQRLAVEAVSAILRGWQSGAREV